MARTFRFTAPADTDLTGYNLADYFPGVNDLQAATDAELQAAYLGPDQDGVGVEWDAENEPLYTLTDGWGGRNSPQPITRAQVISVVADLDERSASEIVERNGSLVLAVDPSNVVAVPAE